MAVASVPSKPGKAARIVAALVIVITLIVLVLVMRRVWPLGADYYYYFRPVAEKFLTGETHLYDAHSQEFFNAPWTLLFLIPLTWFSLETGQAILTVGSIVMLVIASSLLRRDDRRFPASAYVFALLNLHCFDLLIRGQVDGFALLGIALSWWSIQHHKPWMLSLGFWFMAVKPVNIVLPALVYLIGIRRWPRQDQIKAFVLPVVSVLLALPFIGFDAPLRYVRNYNKYPPKDYLSLTFWRISKVADIPRGPFMVLAVLLVVSCLILAWRKGLTELTLSIAICTGLIVAPYVNGNSYVYLMPAVLFIALRNPKLALLAYLATWTPLLRLPIGTRIAPIDMLYPVILLTMAWILVLRESSTAAVSQPDIAPIDPELPVPAR